MQIQKFPCCLRSSSPNLYILINSFKPLQQPLQVGDNIPILEMGKPRHSEALRTLLRMGVGPAAHSRWESMVLFE